MAWKDLQAEYVETRAIRPIQEEAASHVSCAFLVTKPTKDSVHKFCLVIDFRKVKYICTKWGCATNIFRTLASCCDGTIGCWVSISKKHTITCAFEMHDNIFLVSFGREIILLCCTTFWAFFEPILFYTSDAGCCTISPGTAMILQESSPIQLRMLCGGHQLVGLLLAICG